MIDLNEPRTATILHFPRAKLPAKRGRPKSARLGSDSGTPELIMKKLKGETSETLDLCLERRIITPEQHWCGIHLRWLYTLRNGAPGIRAIDPTHIGGKEIKLDDPEWRAARELEYHEAINCLTQSGHAPILRNICVHNDRPAFLKANESKTKKYAKDAAALITTLCDGLDILANLWGKGKRK